MVLSGRTSEVEQVGSPVDAERSEKQEAVEQEASLDGTPTVLHRLPRLVLVGRSGL